MKKQKTTNLIASSLHLPSLSLSFPANQTGLNQRTATSTVNCSWCVCGAAFPAFQTLISSLAAAAAAATPTAKVKSKIQLTVHKFSFFS